MPSTRTLTPLIAILLLPCLVIGVAVIATADSVVTPRQFVAGTTIRADEVNGNFAAHEAAINDNDARLAVLEGASPVRRFVMTGSSEVNGGRLAFVGGPLDGLSALPRPPAFTTYRVVAEVVMRTSTGLGDGFRQVDYFEMDAGGGSFQRNNVSNTWDELVDLPGARLQYTIGSDGVTIAGSAPADPDVTVHFTVSLTLITSEAAPN